MGNKISIIVTHLILDDELFNLSSTALQKIKENTYNEYELINVDNGSYKKYRDLLMDTSDIYIKNKFNVGNGRAWDQGVLASNNDIVILMDSDVFVEKDWDKEMVEKLDENVGITFAYSKRGDLVEDYAGRHDGFLFAFKKETYRLFGPFLCDQPFVLGYFEDDYFYYKVQKGGLKLIACPSSRCWHKGQGTTKKIWNQEMIDGIEANKIWYESKTNGVYPYLNEK